MTTATAIKKLSMATAGAALISLAIGGAAQANVLTFDDLSPTDGYAQIPNGYGGLNWTNFNYYNSSAPSAAESGYENGTVSGRYVAFNGSAGTAAVNGNLFNFDGAYLTGAWNDGLSVTVQGLKNGASKYLQTVVVNTSTPQFFGFHYDGIDTLKFSSSGGEEAGLGGRGTQFAMDDFTYQAVPEPTSMLSTLAFGAFGAAAILKRKQQKRA